MKSERIQGKDFISGIWFRLPVVVRPVAYLSGGELSVLDWPLRLARIDNVNYFIDEPV
jgi:hypothetical protein